MKHCIYPITSQHYRPALRFEQTDLLQITPDHIPKENLIEAERAPFLTKNSMVGI